jgi:predicted ribosomally synthesized peptide with SipW-like signal peptide
MKAFIAAVICAAAIGVGASYALRTQQETVDVAFATSGVRVGDPGHNLVGMN